ncbi:hypothetical protein BU17DRAFT_63302 [Hysterangium stoloniferum]|nr:hypothetical protein BU17DRAFT_63302 [Hysterangium stoloniferum]
MEHTCYKPRFVSGQMRCRGNYDTTGNFVRASPNVYAGKVVSSENMKLLTIRSSITGPPREYNTLRNIDSTTNSVFAPFPNWQFPFGSTFKTSFLVRELQTKPSNLGLKVLLLRLELQVGKNYVYSIFCARNWNGPKKKIITVNDRIGDPHVSELKVTYDIQSAELIYCRVDNLLNICRLEWITNHADARTAFRTKRSAIALPIPWRAPVTTACRAVVSASLSRYWTGQNYRVGNRNPIVFASLDWGEGPDLGPDPPGGEYGETDLD